MNFNFGVKNALNSLKKIYVSSPNILAYLVGLNISKYYETVKSIQSSWEWELARLSSSEAACLFSGDV